MKIFRKYLLIILCSAVLVVTAFYASAKEVTSRFAFCIYDQSQSNGNEISIVDTKDGNFFVILPSYADTEQVFIVHQGNNTVSLDNICLYDGMTCGEFELDKPYAFSIDNRKVATLRFCRSTDVATMYIETVSGSMDEIHADKDYKEYASMTLYTADGEINYCDKLIALEGRGNTSWSLPKKPYTITLRQSSPLLNLGTSRKWVLNSNGFDITHLHNKIVYEFADAIAKDPAWSPDCAHVEVYLNGEYAGLYLLCQKLDAGQDHLNLEQEDYFFELTYARRIWGIPSAFWISHRRFGDIIVPQNVDNNQKNYLQTYISDFQTALFSDTGVHPVTGLAWSDYIDIDSWARKYLIEEVFSNFDGGQASQFFWLDTAEQKLYAGPCWDYDLTFGQFWGTNWSTPYCLLAQRNWEEDQSWYHALCQKDAFMESVVKIYAMEFRPLLKRYIKDIIRNTAEDIERAVFLDRLRWPSLYSETDWGSSVATMEDYLCERMEFLDSLWLEEDDFCTITLQTEEIYNICVPTGTICTSIPETQLFGESGPWYVLETNDPFDITQPISTDITLITQTPE